MRVERKRDGCGSAVKAGGEGVIRAERVPKVEGALRVEGLARAEGTEGLARGCSAEALRCSLMAMAARLG